MMSNQISISPDIKLRYLDKSDKYYLDKSTILFGASNSGKSTILLEILYLMRHKVPNIFVFSPTADTNNAFDGIVPPELIYKTVDIEVLKEIYNRQQAATKMFNMSNNITTLRKLFEKIASYDDIEKAKAAYRNAKIIISKKSKDTSTSTDDKRRAVTDVRKSRDEYLIKLYKNVIRNNKDRLKKMQISESDAYTIHFLDFNPNCVVVFDDCGAILKKFQKEEVMRKIMFQGRHSHINLILTLQDDLNLDSSIKKNAFVNIFTTGRCAMAYFERSSNNFSKKEKIHAAKIINFIFDSSKKKDYKKLVYLRDELEPFRYTVADMYGVFRFGCPSIWKLSDALQKESKTCDFDNDPLLTDFKIDI